MIETIYILFILGLLIIPIIMHFMQPRVVLQHPVLHKVKKVPFLYSWSSLIFSFFVPLFRGDFKWFFIYLISRVLTGGIADIILAFFYNKLYIENLIQNGYEPVDEISKELLISKNIITS